MCYTCIIQCVKGMLYMYYICIIIFKIFFIVFTFIIYNTCITHYVKVLKL